MGIIRPRESTLPALYAVYLALSSLRASAQLVGCDAVACPLNDYGFECCPIWNITAASIGIANFSSALSPEPLTWATTVPSSAGPANSLLGVYQQGYYLGTPPSLNLQGTKKIEGCALFFQGISSSLQFPQSHPSTEVGTCQDALGSSCVSDLVSQVNREFSELMKAANAISDICSDLKAALRNSALRTCNAPHGGSWSTINVKNITGPSAPPPIRQGSCHPTTGANYSVSLVDTSNMAAEPISTIIEPFASGVTPIHTVLHSPNSTASEAGASSGRLSTPEFYLGSLRRVSQNSSLNVLQGGLVTHFRADLGMAALSVIVAVAVVLF